jgi:hypothetical protein
MKPASRDNDYLDAGFGRLENCLAVTFRDFPTAVKQRAVQVNGYEANRHALGILTLRSLARKRESGSWQGAAKVNGNDAIRRRDYCSFRETSLREGKNFELGSFFPRREVEWGE